MEEQIRFKHFISDIVFNELDENQQSIYLLEGDKRIEELFKAGNIEEFKKIRKTIGLDYGLGIEEINGIVKNALEFGSLIVSVFSLYLAYKTYNKEEKNEKLKELEDNWKSTLVLDEHIDEKEAELIVKKYSSSLKNLIE